MYIGEVPTSFKQSRETERHLGLYHATGRPSINGKDGTSKASPSSPIIFITVWYDVAAFNSNHETNSCLSSRAAPGLLRHTSICLLSYKSLTREPGAACISPRKPCTIIIPWIIRGCPCLDIHSIRLVVFSASQPTLAAALQDPLTKCVAGEQRR